ncbi:MAG: hypothetical protein PHG12_10385 [Sphaerochaeta sp.]|nr:hypothetical protein [Sphaerochaeta sp.]
MNAMQNDGDLQTTVTADAFAAVNADPKWERRRRVIEALEEYKARLNARSSLRDRYETLCTRLHSGRSSRITGMPTNHDQFAAGDRFAEMLDEKMELERALAEVEEVDEMAVALSVLDERARDVIDEFYFGDQPKKATENLCVLYGLSSTWIYHIRDTALDELADILQPEQSALMNAKGN